MYSIPKRVLEALRNDAPQSIEIKVSPLSSDEFFLTGEDIRDKLEIERAVLTGDKLELGSAVMSKMSFNIENYSGKFNKIDLEGANLFVRIGIELPNEAPYIMPMGYFQILSPPRTLETIKVTAYDRMSRFDRTYITELSFPATVYQILTDCCRKCNVPCAVTSDWVNANMTVSKKPEGDNITFRQVLIWCAQLMGICFFMDRDGRLGGAWYEDKCSSVHPDIKSSDRFKGETGFAENEITVTGVRIETGDRKEHFAGTKDYCFNITGNALIQSDSPINEIAQKLYDRRKLTYRPMKCATHSFPHLDPLDRIKFVKRGVNLVDVGPLTQTGVYHLTLKEPLQPGTYSISFEGDSNAQTETMLVYVSNKDASQVNELQFPKKIYSSITFRADSPIKKINLYPGNNYASSQNKQLIIKKFMLEEGEASDDFEPYSTVEFETVLTNVKYVLNGNSILESKGKTAHEEKNSLPSSFTSAQLSLLEQKKEETKKELESAQQLLLEVNETMLNSFGYYMTQTKDENGAVITYTHNRPKLEESQTIYCRKADGFVWTNDGWNNGKPKWKYGVDKNGNAILQTIAVNKLYAQYIESGILSSKTGKFTINLDTGKCIFSDMQATGVFTTLGKIHDLKVSNHTFYPGDEFLEYDSLGLYKYDKKGNLDSAICFEESSKYKDAGIMLGTPSTKLIFGGAGLWLENKPQEQNHDVFLSLTDEPSNFSRGIKTGYEAERVDTALDHMYGFTNQQDGRTYVEESRFTISRKDRGEFVCPAMAFKVDNVIHQQMGNLEDGREVSAELELYTTDSNYIGPNETTNAHSVSLKLSSCGVTMATITFNKNGTIWIDGRKVYDKNA